MSASEKNSSSKKSQNGQSNFESSDSLGELISLLIDLQFNNEKDSSPPRFTATTAEKQKAQTNKPQEQKKSEDLIVEKNNPKIKEISNFNQKKSNSFSTLSSEKNKKTPLVKSSETSTNTSDLANLKQAIANLQKKVELLERKIDEPTDIVNPILPLITELLNLKNIESQESLLKALIPVIDRAIQERFQQDKQMMGAALADILPTAITHEVKTFPTEIAKAIAPEIAIAIQEQIRLDPDSISTTLGPEMGEAIKTQIRVGQDAMVDALYPVIGGTVSKYMVELVKSINDKVESAFSFEGIKRKIRAKMQGVSEAELILQESINYQVQAVFLIHKTSGLVIREIHPSLEMTLEADMVAGLLTAIRSFVNECIAPPGGDTELHEIQYDSSKIVLEVAGYCYIAVVIKGEPSKKFIQKLRKTLGIIALKYGKTISNYDGNPATIPNSIEIHLERLTKNEVQEKSSKPPYALIMLVSAILLFWGFVLYRAHVANRVETQVANALDAAPELSVYQIESEVRHGKLILSGRLPNEYLKTEAVKIVSKVAPTWKLDNQIVAIAVPPDPVITAGEIERVTWIFNQEKGVAITAQHEYQTKNVNIRGIVPDVPKAEQITQAFKKIPGVELVTNTVQIKPILETRIYFKSGSTQFSSPDTSTQIRTIRQFLEQNPKVHLRIVGHADRQGQESKNQQLGIQRARIVQQALIDEQINPTRLQVSATTALPPDVTPEQPLWLSRCVRFEIFIPNR